jgi:hypothetical protein
LAFGRVVACFARGFVAQLKSGSSVLCQSFSEDEGDAQIIHGFASTDFSELAVEVSGGVVRAAFVVLVGSLVELLFQDLLDVWLYKYLECLKRVAEGSSSWIKAQMGFPQKLSYPAAETLDEKAQDDQGKKGQQKAGVYLFEVHERPLWYGLSRRGSRRQRDALGGSLGQRVRTVLEGGVGRESGGSVGGKGCCWWLMAGAGGPVRRGL